MNLRRFNENDWKCFGGAEKFSNGRDPWILEDVSTDGDFPYTWFEDYLTTVSFVADRDGIEVHGVNGTARWDAPIGSEIQDRVGELILKTLSQFDQVSFENLIQIGFREV